MYACYIKYVMAGRERHFSSEGEKLVNKGWIFFLQITLSTFWEVRLSLFFSFFFLNLRLEKFT